jgi:hypothetical protein
MCQCWNYFDLRSLLVTRGGREGGIGGGRKKEGREGERRDSRVEKSRGEKGRRGEEERETDGLNTAPNGLMVNRWDSRIESLSSTLNAILPDVFPKTDIPPIPEQPPNIILVRINELRFIFRREKK